MPDDRYCSYSTPRTCALSGSLLAVVCRPKGVSYIKDKTPDEPRARGRATLDTGLSNFNLACLDGCKIPARLRPEDGPPLKDIHNPRPDQLTRPRHSTFPKRERSSRNLEELGQQTPTDTFCHPPLPQPPSKVLNGHKFTSINTFVVGFIVVHTKWQERYVWQRVRSTRTT